MDLSFSGTLWPATKLLSHIGRIRTEYGKWQEISHLNLSNPSIHTSIYEMSSLEIYKCTNYIANSGISDLLVISVSFLFCTWNKILGENKVLFGEINVYYGSCYGYWGEERKGKNLSLRQWPHWNLPCAMWRHCLPMEHTKKVYEMSGREEEIALQDTTSSNCSLRLTYWYSLPFLHLPLFLVPRYPSFLLTSCLTSETIYRYFLAASNDRCHFKEMPNTNIQAAKRKNLWTQVYFNVTHYIKA